MRKYTSISCHCFNKIPTGFWKMGLINSSHYPNKPMERLDFYLILKHFKRFDDFQSMFQVFLNVIHSFLNHIKRKVMQCSNQHKIVYGYHTIQTVITDTHQRTIYENTITINLFKRSYVYMLWNNASRENSSKNSTQQSSSSLPGQHIFPFLWTDIFSVI